MHEDDPSEGHEVAQEENVIDLDAQNIKSVKDLIIKEKYVDVQAL